jgi:hypothetical protein
MLRLGGLLGGGTAAGLFVPWEGGKVLSLAEPAEAADLAVRATSFPMSASFEAFLNEAHTLEEVRRDYTLGKLQWGCARGGGVPAVAAPEKTAVVEDGGGRRSEAAPVLSLIMRFRESGSGTEDFPSPQSHRLGLGVDRCTLDTLYIPFANQSKQPNSAIAHDVIFTPHKRGII